jgi:hypothetical protein
MLIATGVRRFQQLVSLTAVVVNPIRIGGPRVERTPLTIRKVHRANGESNFDSSTIEYHTYRTVAILW